MEVLYAMYIYTKVKGKNMLGDRKVGAGVGVIIIKNGKVLLGHRNIDPAKADSALNGAGTWTLPGGKLDFGESFEAGAAREVLEETGIVLKKAKVICVNNDMVPTAHFVTLGVLVEEWEGQPQIREPDEITEWRWFDLNNLPKPMFPPSGKILENYRQEKFYIQYCFTPNLSLNPSPKPLCPARAGHLSLSGEKNIVGSVCGEGNQILLSDSERS